MESASPKPNILVVDDTPENLQLLMLMLQRVGFSVRTKTNGFDALTAIEQLVPDLVLLDISMPEMDGYEVCRRIKARPDGAEIPVLFVSALSDTMDKVRGFEVGAVDFVSKPFEFAEVVARVRLHLELQRQRRELQASLARQRELEELRDSLTHMIVHDMRSPLQSLHFTINMVRNAVPPGEIDLMAQAERSVRRLIDMVTDMLHTSRLESRAMVLQRERTDLGVLAADVVESMRLLSGDSVLSIESEPGVFAEVDVELVRRVIANLVGNAIKFVRARGQVAVRVLRAGDQARIEVHDNGVGIAPEHQALIFEKFGQVGAGHRKHGSGLGLTFAKMAVQAHGGSIGVASVPGQGSTFWCLLPLAAADSADL